MCQVLQNILETETEYSKDLQSLLTNYLRALQSADKYELFTLNSRIRPPLCSCWELKNCINVRDASRSFALCVSGSAAPMWR